MEGGQPASAGMVAIGDELLSGRTRDRNIAHLAGVLTAIGIDLREVRIVSDEEPAIVEAVNALRARYTVVFTSGGIGPTHDDRTADAIAAAFGVPIGEDARALALLEPWYRGRGIEFTPARRRMARVPHGAELIENAVSVAPGFRIGNVHVMAGVPSVFNAMLESLVPGLPTGPAVLSEAIDSAHPEGAIGGPLGAIAAGHKAVSIGSYPRMGAAGPSTQIVVRGRDEAAVAAASAEVRAMLAALGTSPSA